MVSHPYLIFRNMQEILHFLFLLTFSYHWETLYEPHCQQCWVKFSHASHVILQLILYKLWSKTLTTSFPTPSIANSDITVMSNWKSYPKKWSHTSYSYLKKYARNFTFSIFTNFQLPLGTTLSSYVKLSSSMLVMSFCSLYFTSYKAKHC